MEFLNSIDQLTQNHTWFCVVVITVAFVWAALRWYLGKLSIAENYQVSIALVDLILIPLAIMSVGGVLQFALQLGQLSVFRPQGYFVVHLIAILSIAWCLARFVEIYILSRSRRDDIVNYLPGLQRGLLFGGCLFIGIIIFATIKGYSITGLYVSTGAAAALVAFAMQRTLGDLFSGIALSIEHPFRLGDWVELADGTQGKIIDVNWRATRFRTWDESTLVIPNSELARQPIKNMHGKDHVFAPWYEVKISADVDPGLAKAILLEAALRCKKIRKKPLPTIRLIDATTVPYTYMVWVSYENFTSMFAGRDELFREIHYGLKQAGIQVASDTHELHTRSFKAMTIEPPTTLLALKGLDIANIFNDDELEHMASMSQYHVYDAGTVLIKEGSVAQAFDIIVSGIVESSVTTKANSRKIVSQFKPGEYFGIGSMIIDTPSVLQFSALTDVTLIRVNFDCFRAILSERPDLNKELANLVKQRMDGAEEARHTGSKPSHGFTLQDILKRMDRLLH